MTGGSLIVGARSGPGRRGSRRRRSRRCQGRRDLVGYGPYLDRVPDTPGQVRHASDNRVEIDRARHALATRRRGALGRRGVGRRSRRLRHGRRRVRGDRGRRPGLARARCTRPARRHRHAGRGGAARRAAGPRFLRDLAVRQPQAVGGRRAAARSGGGRAISCIALYNPASKARPRQIFEAFDAAARPQARGYAGGLRPRRGPSGRAHRAHDAGRCGPRHRRHEHAGADRLERDALLSSAARASRPGC